MTAVCFENMQFNTLLRGQFLQSDVKSRLHSGILISVKKIKTN